MSSPTCHQRRSSCARGAHAGTKPGHHRLKNGRSWRAAGLFSATVVRSAGRRVPAADPAKAKMAVMPARPHVTGRPPRASGAWQPQNCRHACAAAGPAPSGRADCPAARPRRGPARRPAGTTAAARRTERGKRPRPDAVLESLDMLRSDPSQCGGRARQSQGRRRAGRAQRRRRNAQPHRRKAIVL